jgi:NAD(P)-dependent dehydrogenase (short-subunit alcohol dehydrogenase family)
LSHPSLEGKNALVTGGARRLGRAIALGLAGDGAGVVIHYGSSSGAARDLAAEIRRDGGAAWPLQADLGDPETVEHIIPRAAGLAGGLDILVSNASVFPGDSIATVAPDDVTAAFSINAWAPFALSRSFARNVGRGSVVNILDTRVAGYDWKHVSYILSKNALALLTRMAAVEFAPDIAVNAVAPGLILPPPGKDMSYLASLTHTVPLKRHGAPNDVVGAVLYLVKSAFVTGQVLYVDGGRHLVEYGDGSNPD